MLTNLRCGILCTLCVLTWSSFLAPAHLWSAEPTGPSSIVPLEKDRPRHDGFVEVAKAGGVDLLFLGDSITDGWRNTGKAVWDTFWEPLKAANFGISADRTEHVIWRIRNGELEGIEPKLVVLMIGTNNGGSAEDVALGIQTIISDIQERSPKSRVLLLGIFPRGAKPDGRTRNQQVNDIMEKYADGRRVVYMDIGPAFLTADGTLETDIMPDLLHPNAKGYQIWADAIHDTVVQMLREDPARLLPPITKPSPITRVAKCEAMIVSGKVGSGVKALERLIDDKDPETANAATLTLALVDTWKKGLDEEIASRQQEGDVYLAAELTAGLVAAYIGDEQKAYKQQLSELKKDPAYDAGAAFQKVRAIPYAQRRDPRFAAMVASFLKKYPDGFYAQQVEALLPKE
jgi:lysophospholipase L1-like esterase